VEEVAMAEIRPFVLLQDWMFDLGLNPSEVIAVAVIYGFTQDGQHTCHASIDYFGRMCKLKRRATVYMLRRLEKMGIVRRVETLGKINEYSLDLEGCKNCTRAINGKNPCKNCIPFPPAPPYPR
jgi:hypothetical protein